MILEIFVVQESESPGYQAAYHVFLEDPKQWFNNKKIEYPIDMADFIVDELAGDKMFTGVGPYPAIKKFSLEIRDL